MKDASKPAGIPLVFLIVSIISVLLAGESPLSAKEKTSPLYENTNKIDIFANKLVFDRENNFAEFSGNVKATEQGTVLTADTMKIYFSDTRKEEKEKAPTSRNIKEIKASGHVKITFDDTMAISENAQYSIPDNVLILTGKGTRLTRKGNSITGDKITIFRSEGRIAVEGNTQNRVRAEFFPENGPDAQKPKTAN